MGLCERERREKREERREKRPLQGWFRLVASFLFVVCIFVYLLSLIVCDSTKSIIIIIASIKILYSLIKKNG